MRLSYFDSDGSLILNVIASDLYEKICNSKKISKATVSEEDVLAMLVYINNLNSLDQYQRSFDNQRFDEILIPECFSDFVMPKKVTQNSDDRCPDLLIRPKVDGKIMSEAEVRSFTERMYGMYKESPKYKTLDELRREVLLNDADFGVKLGESFVTAFQSSGWKVVYPVIPAVAQLYGSNYFCESADYALYKYLNEWSVVKA